MFATRKLMLLVGFGVAAGFGNDAFAGSRYGHYRAPRHAHVHRPVYSYGGCYSRPVVYGGYYSRPVVVASPVYVAPRPAYRTVVYDDYGYGGSSYYAPTYYSAPRSHVSFSYHSGGHHGHHGHHERHRSYGVSVGSGGFGGSFHYRR